MDKQLEKAAGAATCTKLRARSGGERQTPPRAIIACVTSYVPRAAGPEQ
ncbi:MAG: hypothetical protein ABSC94_23875 [Polyangiaceae bacterium]